MTALAKLMKQRAKMIARKILDIWGEGEILRINKLMIITFKEKREIQRVLLMRQSTIEICLFKIYQEIKKPIDIRINDLKGSQIRTEI